MLSWSFSHFIFTVVLALFFAGTRLDAKRILVDDAYTNQITYSPDSGWNVGDNCSSCFARPEKSQMCEGTWHDAIAGLRGNPNDTFLTFVFTGISVTARYTAVGSIDRAITFNNNVNVKYSIDDVPRGSFVRDSAPTTDRTTYIYNQTLFDITGLANVKHTLRVDLMKPSLLLFDYLIYDDGSEVTSSTAASPAISSISTDKGSTATIPVMIIGWVVAAIVVLVLCVILIWYLLKRRREHRVLRTHKLLPIPPPQFLPGAQPMSMAATTKKFTQTDQTTARTSVVMGPNPTGAPLIETNQINARSDLIAWSAVPPNPPTTHTNVTAQAQIPDEPVEEGVMSRQISRGGTLPPYSPGGLLREEDVPPLPNYRF